MGQGLSAVLPIVVIRVVADLLMQLLLHVEVVLLGAISGGTGGLLSRHQPGVSGAIVAQSRPCGRPRGSLDVEQELHRRKLWRWFWVTRSALDF